MLNTIIYSNTDFFKGSNYFSDEEYVGIRVVDVVDDLDAMDQAVKSNKVDLIVIEMSNSMLLNPIKNDLKKYRLPIIMSDYFHGDKKAIREKVQNLKKSFKARKKTKTMILIASSTGGPKALQKVIPKLPNNLNATVLIVQHMPANFTKSFAKRLDSISALNVKEAEEGEKLEQGTVYIAPGDYHISIDDRGSGCYVKLDKGERYMGLRPAADILMESAAKIKRYKKLGIILTGMGSDGAEGVKSLKKSGSYNLVQDEDSSVIYGMPRAALETGMVDEVLALDQISDRILLKVGCDNGFRY